MKIEIEGDTQHIDVIESVVRDIVPIYENESGLTKPHFQARIHIAEEGKDQYYRCEISFYDDSGLFLGVSETDAEKKRSVTGEPRTISEPIDIPTNATVLKARFILLDRRDKLSYGSLLIVAVLGFILALVVHWFFPHA